MPLMDSHSKCTIPPIFMPKKLNLNMSKALGLTSGVQGLQVTGERHVTQTTPQEAKSQTQSKEHPGHWSTLLKKSMALNHKEQ